MTIQVDLENLLKFNWINKDKLKEEKLKHIC